MRAKAASESMTRDSAEGFKEGPAIAKAYAKRFAF